MKILIVHTIPIKEIKANLIQTLNMARSFVRGGADIEIAVISDDSPNLLEEKLESIIEGVGELIKVTRFNSRYKWLRPSELARLVSVYSVIKNTDRVIFTRSPYVVFVAQRMGKEVVYESHNSYFSKTLLINKVFTKIFQYISFGNKLRLFVSISQNLSDYWENKGINATKLIALHDGVELRPLNKVEVTLVKNSVNNKLRFCYAGSLYEDRKPARFIDLGKRFPHSEFVIIGGPNEVALTLSQTCLNEGVSNVRFLGRIEHYKVRNELLKADVLLALWSKSVRTIEYCSPLKVFEYMEVEKLIIADGFTPIKEILTNNINSLLVAPDNFQSLCNTIQKVHDNPERLLGLGVGNRHLISSKYSWDKRAKLILEKL